MSDVQIDLDTSQEISTQTYTVTVDTRRFDGCKLFNVVKYGVKYKDPIAFPYEMFLYFTKRPYGTLFNVRTTKVIDTVEVFYNVYNQDEPLIVGLYAAYQKKFYSYSFLRDAQWLTFANDNFIKEQDLLAHLVTENNRTNKKLRLVVDKYTNNVNVNEAKSRVDNFFIITYSPQHDQRKDSVLSINFMLSLRINTEISEWRLDRVHNESFDAVTVYYSSRYALIRVPVLVEILNDGRSYFFSRLEDQGETFWRQVTLGGEGSSEELLYLLRSVDRLITVEDKSDASVFGGRVQDLYTQYPDLVDDADKDFDVLDVDRHPDTSEHASSGAVNALRIDVKPRKSSNFGFSFFIGILGLCCGISSAYLLYKYFSRPGEIKMQRLY